MAADPDPYRTLGLPRGAPLGEVKKAYRRLAKANHPDAAGEAALPRFLAIQAAYDQIAGPGSAAAGGTAAGRRPGPPRQPWEADPTRANATHRAYAGRSRRTRASGPRPRPQPGPPPPRPSGGGASGGTGRPARPPNKATLGSTSYDGADAEPFEPDWGGASWYGTTSGTYWTLNPKEYADPRKHGPEYQARARRAAASARGEDLDDGETDADGAGAESPAPADEGAAAAGVSGEAGPVAPESAAASGPARPAPPPTHTTTSWWEATAGTGPGTAAAAPGAEAPATPADAPRSATTDGVGWSWLEGDRPGIGARVARAALGWAPIALGVGWLAGEVTGCGRFSADCAPSTSALVWVIQVAILGALLLLPRLASVAAVAGLAAIVAAVPGALLISATAASSGEDGTRGEANVAVLAGLIVVAWVGGAAVGLLRTMRRGPRPVS